MLEEALKAQGSSLVPPADMSVDYWRQPIAVIGPHVAVVANRSRMRDGPAPRPMGQTWQTLQHDAAADLPLRDGLLKLPLELQRRYRLAFHLGNHLMQLVQKR